ncbi:nucleotidyltransferase family protein [Chitinophaga sp.]|uniref:nucleotidyltransferase family protein n=1 Tax=Chitinophaga sp. TaxID=1869181 RepID=UPI0031DB9555
MRHTGAIILAAGASRRLGTPKQQVRFQQQSLLQRIIQTTRQTNANPVVVVLGAFADTILPDLQDSETNIVVNTDWESGMGSSIQSGVRELIRIDHNVSDVLILLCDQPFITPVLLEELITTHYRQNKGITACSYGPVIGTPVIFSSTFFPGLLALTGQEGAKKIILQHQQEVTTIPFPEGIIDIDTPEDLENLR